MGGPRIIRATRRLNAAKEVGVRKLRDGYCLDLPDWTQYGSYHRHVKGLRREELEALRECIGEVLERDR